MLNCLAKVCLLKGATRPATTQAKQNLRNYFYQDIKTTLATPVKIRGTGGSAWICRVVLSSTRERRDPWRFEGAEENNTGIVAGTL